MHKQMLNQLIPKIGLMGLLIVFTTMFAGCQVIADIFKVGLVVGIVIVVVVIGLIMMVARMFKK